MVKITGCATRDGVLIAGVKKQSEAIQKFPVRFPQGDVRTYRGDQLLLRGKKAPLMEFIRVGDVIFTKETLGVVRFIGLHEDFVGTVIVLESIDPVIPTDPSVGSFRKLFPSASLSDSRSYNILRKGEDILKVLPPDVLLFQLSKIKDKYLAYLEDSRESAKAFEKEMHERSKKVSELEDGIKKQKEQNAAADESAEVAAEATDGDVESNTVQILFQSGRLGIKAVWSNGKVEGVSEGGQAEKLGVQVGWTIIKIDDEDYLEETLDARVDGSEDYKLTFLTTTDAEKPIKDSAPPQQEEPEPGTSEVPLKEMLFTETEREKYEIKIRKLKEQIEDTQYTIEDLQTKNDNLENEQKELPKLQVKVKQLRSSKVMFQGQIKEVQKRQKEWKKKAEVNEKAYIDLLEKKSAERGRQNDSSNKMNVDAAKKHKRRLSAKMPTPDVSNTVSLSSTSIPEIGAGSSETMSLSKVVADKKSKKKKTKRGMSFFGNR